MLAFQWPLRAAPVNEPEQPADHPDGQFAPNAFIRIDKTGKTTLVMPQAEMGQGVYTAIAMILAEELDADFAQVVLEHAPPSDKLYGNPLFGIQVTGNSNSIRAFWDKLREAGAARARHAGCRPQPRNGRSMRQAAATVKRRGDPCREQSQAHLRRARRCRRVSCRRRTSRS